VFLGVTGRPEKLANHKAVLSKRRQVENERWDGETKAVDEWKE